MNPENISFDDCDLGDIFQIIDKQTQTGFSFHGSENSKSSVNSQISNKLPLPRDLNIDDSIKIYSFCQILQDPECPSSVALIKDSFTEEVRNHPKSSKEDAVANRYRYCREVIRPYLKEYPQDCPGSEEKFIQDAITSASEDFPDYQPCYEYFPINRGKSELTRILDKQEKNNGLGISNIRSFKVPRESKPKPKVSNKKCNTDLNHFEQNFETDKIDKETSCSKTDLFSTQKFEKQIAKSVTNFTPKYSSKIMDKPKECPSKTSISRKACPGYPQGIPVKECGSSKTCKSKGCPTNSDPSKSCPLRDCPPKACDLKDCPPDVCAPKECEPESYPSEYCPPDQKCPPKECPLADNPPTCAPPKCPSFDCKNKIKPVDESSSNSNKGGCHSKIKRANVEKSYDDAKHSVVYTERSRDEDCGTMGGSTSLIDIDKIMKAHNETMSTLKNAMEDFLGKVYKTTQNAVNTITTESAKQIDKLRKCESSNTDRTGENKSVETITTYNFVRKIESKSKTDKDTSSEDDGVINKMVKNVESTITIVGVTVADKIPDQLKPSNNYNDDSSKYDDTSSPKRVSNELIHDPANVLIANNVFTTIKSKICSIFCEKDEKKPNVSKKSSCSSSSSKKDDEDDTDDKLIEKLIE